MSAPPTPQPQMLPPRFGLERPELEEDATELLSDEEARGVAPAREGAAESPRAMLRSTRPPPPVETEQEIQRLTASRIGLTMLMLLAFVSIGFVAVWFARAPWVRVMGAVSITLTALGLLGTRYFGTRTGARAQRNYHRSAFFAAVSAVPVIYVMGTYTAFAGSLGLFVLLYSMSAPLRNAALVTATIGVSHVALHLAVTGQLIADLGVLSVEGSTAQLALGLMGVIGVYALALGVGQVVRRRTERTLTELHEAARQVAMREAMLREARLALKQAGGIGQTGRFSDQRFGHYVVGAVLGRGGMGEIYEAEDVRDGTQAAIKLLRIPNATDQGVWDRFKREAEIVASFDSPHVVRVLEVGDDGTFPFLVMERLRGRDLAHVLREVPFLSPSEVSELIRQCAEGLAAAHSQAVAHRDVKPHNLYRCSDGSWKVLDFGVARLFDGSETASQQLVGTPAYIAPEQLQKGIATDHRADIHALAAVAYRALTGSPAFYGSDVNEVLYGVASRLPTRPDVQATVATAVCDVLRIALAKSPDDRFDDVREFATALREALVHGRASAAIERRAESLNATLPWASSS